MDDNEDSENNLAKMLQEKYLALNFDKQCCVRKGILYLKCVSEGLHNTCRSESQGQSLSAPVLLS